MTNFILVAILAVLVYGFMSLEKKFDTMNYTFQACLETAKEDKP